MIRLEQLRYDEGLTPEQLAKRIEGVGARTISAIERGEVRRPRPKTAKALADHFGVTATQLLEQVPEGSAVAEAA